MAVRRLRTPEEALLRAAARQQEKARLEEARQLLGAQGLLPKPKAKAKPRRKPRAQGAG